ncbi:MAG: hypothetical protein ACLU38_01810 [Dysosmobacter sp.]
MNGGTTPLDGTGADGQSGGYALRHGQFCVYPLTYNEGDAKRVYVNGVLQRYLPR